jgi:hypothetical protein
VIKWFTPKYGMGKYVVEAKVKTHVSYSVFAMIVVKLWVA